MPLVLSLLVAPTRHSTISGGKGSRSLVSVSIILSVVWPSAFQCLVTAPFYRLVFQILREPLNLSQRLPEVVDLAIALDQLVGVRLHLSFPARISPARSASIRCVRPATPRARSGRSLAANPPPAGTDRPGGFDERKRPNLVDFRADNGRSLIKSDKRYERALNRNHPDNGNRRIECNRIHQIIYNYKSWNAIEKRDVGDTRSR